MAPKVLAVIKNTLAILAPVYVKKIVDSESPIKKAKIQNKVWAREADIPLIPKLIYITIPRGANATTHIIGPV